METTSNRWAGKKRNPPDTEPLTHDDLAKLDEHQRRCLKVYSNALLNNQGIWTPFEEFLDQLMTAYGIRAVTPDDVEDELASFRENFDDATQATRQFIENYPAMFAVGYEASPQLAEIGWNQEDQGQIAAHIECARLVFRDRPELVVSAEFPAEWRQFIAPAEGVSE